jgi:small subunit ribosomal protein S16
MVKIRMVRMGSNKKPFYRIVVADIKRKINGRYLENVGWYDPKLAKNNMELKLERIDHWLGRGALLTDSVASLVKKHRKARPAAPAAEPAAATA